MAGACDLRLFNVIILGIAFMLIFTAFQTSSLVEQRVLNDAKNSTKFGNFSGDGYTSLSIIYAAFATSNWIAPSIVSVCGPRVSMIIGGIPYGLFIASFLWPMTWALYLGSVLVGFGAAVLWTAQGSFLTLNSDPDTVSRNSGVFWALLQCSFLFGNLFVYIKFYGITDITDDDRFVLYSVLAVTCAVGILVLLILRKPPQNNELDLINSESPGRTSACQGAIHAFKRSIDLLRTKQMLLLCVTFAYTGFELNFFGGVYCTCVGNTLNFGVEANALIGICGMFIGAGEVLGGAVFGLAGNRTNKYGRDPIILLGYLVHMVAFYLIFINIPTEAPIDKTSVLTDNLIEPNKYVAVACAFLLGFGDASFNTQIYSVLGYLYPEDSAPAFAIYKCIQSVACAIGFAYSAYMFLRYQLLILVITGTLGGFCFFIVEWGIYGDTVTADENGEDPEDDDDLV